MQQLFAQSPVVYSGDFGLEDDEGYLMSILAMLMSEDRDSFYQADSLESSLVNGIYTVPQLKFSRREGKK